MTFVTSRNGRPPIGKRAMTPLERQRRRRAKLAKGGATKRSLLYNLGLAEAAFEELMTAMGQVFNARRSWARGH